MTEMTGPLIILADNFEMARWWARENDLDLHTWRYVNEVHQVLGRRDGRYVTVTAGSRARLGPDGWERRAEIRAVLRRNGFVSIEEAQ